MRNTLLWVVDSPYSRCVKWLLLRENVAHDDHIMNWEDMAKDGLLQKYNSKLQVPTLIINNEIINDSLLIALRYLSSDWHLTFDAKLFRLADSDVESAIIFLFRANLLASKFGQSEQSELMYYAGIETYKKSVDYFLEELIKQPKSIEVGFGLVLLYSTLLAASSISGQGLIKYRLEELAPVFDSINSDAFYKALVDEFSPEKNCKVPFSYGY